MPKIEYAAPIPEKAHVLHVGLLTDEGVIHEVPARKSHFVLLGPIAPPYNAKQTAYACECEKWHHKRDATVRAKWDADDKAKADAAAAAAKAAEDAKFIMIPQGFVKGEQGAITGVRVTVTHQGHTCSCVIPADPAQAEANARAVWQASKDATDAEANSLAAFNLSK